MTLKANSKKVLDVYAGQTKKNATQAYKEVHPQASDVTARTNAHQLLKKPEAQIYLQQHIDQATQNIVELANNARKENVRLAANQDILDRTHGKPTVKTELNTTNLNLNIEANEQMKQDFTDWLKAKTASSKPLQATNKDQDV